MDAGHHGPQSPFRATMPNGPFAQDGDHDVLMLQTELIIIGQCSNTQVAR